MKTLRALILAVVSSTLSLTAVVVPMSGSTASAATRVAHVGTVPGAPTGALATAGNGQATVTWRAPRNAGSSPITSYTVTSDTYLSAYPVRTCTTPDGRTLSCIVTGLTNGVLYAFTVTATNSAGTSVASVYTNTVTPTAPPTPPTAVTARAGSSSAAVSWTAPTSNGGAAISSYTASAFNANGTVASTCRTTSGTNTAAATNCTIAGLTNGLTYTVSVVASNGTSTSTPSTPAVSVTPVGPPPAPGTPVAVPGNTQATVTWTAPISNGGSAISGYTVTSTTTANSCTATVTLSCTVTGLTNGRTYAFRVVARNASGAGTQSAASNSVIPGVIPGAPTTVVATAGNASATVTWKAPTSNGGSPILRYVVTSTPGSVTCTTANGTTLSCVVSGLTNGTAYTFKVVAVNGIGSGPASTASNSVTPSLPPNVPTNVIAVAGNAQATVSWTPAATITTPIVSYTASAIPAGRRTTCTTPNSSTHTCTITGLTNGRSYTFTVVANFARGSSAASTPSNAVTPATLPGAPTGLTVTAGNTSIIASWVAPRSNGGSPITSYVATAFDLNGNAISTCTTATLTCTIPGLTTGTPYRVSVKAANSVGFGPSTPLSASVTPSTLPSAPVTVTAVAGNGAATVSWLAPLSSGGTPVTSYLVTAYAGATASYTCATNGALSCVVNGLTNGTAYTFKVVATNTNGSGPASVASRAVTPVGIVGAPTVPLSVTGVPGTSLVTVSWLAPASNGGKTITGYTVTGYGPSGAVAGSCTTAGALSCTVFGLTNGAGYTFSVYASNANGRGPSSPSTSVVIPVTLPGSPTSISTVPGNSQVTVSWVAPSFNGGTPILSYVVTAFDPGSNVAGSCSTPNGSTTSCTVTGLTNGIAYTFAVSATNAVGVGTASVSAPATPSTIPSSPTGVVATAGNGAATVHWTAGANGGSPITGYTVTAFDNVHVTAGTCSTVGATSCTITGLTNGIAYTFSVTATNANGSSNPSAESSAVTPTAPVGTPSVPQSVSAVADDASATISWSAPSSTGGSAITGYTVTAYDQDGVVAGTCSVDGSTLTCSITGLTNGVGYTFSVVASNVAGSGPASALTSVVVPTGNPAAPSGVIATPGAGQVAISWTAPTFDGGSPITSYTVTASPGGLTCTTPDGSTLTCTITGLTNGVGYTFTVVATNTNGDSPASSPSSTVTPSAVPSPPLNVTATTSNGGATISWDAPDSSGGSPITGYTVTSSPGGLTCVTNGELTCNIGGLTNGVSYTFTVTATNGDGASDPSSPSNAVIPSTLPTAPLNPTALASNGQATITWTAPASDAGSPITSYTVTSSPGGLTCTTPDGSTLTCTVTGLTNGTAYTFTVVATNGNGNGDTSVATAPVTPSSIPGAPLSVSGKGGNGQAVVTWSPPASDGGSPITGYTVTAFDPNGHAAGGCTTDGSTTSCSIFNLTNGVGYTFSVTATNANGTGLASAPSSPPTVPTDVSSKPLSVTGTPGNGQVTVSWLAPGSTGGTPITGYTVTASTGGTPIATCTTTGALSCVVTGLTNGVAYTFTVVATNSNGPSPASDPSTPVVPSTTPDAPTISTATAGNGQITVAWTAPGFSGGSPITGYSATAYDSGLNVISTCTTSGALTCTITGLTNGTAYTVSVQAINVNGTGTASTTLSATPSTKPTAPVNVTAIPSNGSAIVSWTVPSSDGGSPILSYTVTAYSGVNALTTCTTPDGTTLTCTVTGLSNGTAYTFKVVATNANGASPASLASSPPTTPTGNPGAPTAVQSIAGNGQLTASWTAPVATGGSPITLYTATAYNGNTASANCQTSDGSTLTCTITGLTNGTAYTVKVTATNINGTSPASIAATAVTPSTKPNAPTNVTAVAGSAQATVSWSAPSFNGGSPITGYTVTSDPDFRTCTTNGATSCTVTGLSNGTAYTFTVIATNVNGDSPSSLASQQPATPSSASTAPSSVTATAGNASALVSWHIPSANGGQRITSYTVTSLPGAKTCSVTVAVGDLSATFNCTVNGLTNGTSYTFSVKATNGAGTSAASPASNTVTPSTTPGPPASVTAYAGNNSATVSWNAPQTNGGSPILGYKVTANPGGNVCTTNGALSCTVTSLTNGTSYTFTVIATNANGDSIASAPTSTIVPSSLPGPPIAPTATAGFQSATVQWTAPFSNGGSPILTYTVTSTPDGKTCTTNGALFCTVTGLTTGVTYTFTVFATNSDGQGSDSPSSNAVLMPTTPGAPRNVTGAPTDKAITVSWLAPMSDGGASITAYTVHAYDGVTPAGTCTTTGALTCTVTGLTNGTSYTFTVVATNLVGDGPASTASAAIQAGITAPSAPSGLFVMPGKGFVTVFWNPSASNGGAPITWYDVKVFNRAGRIVGSCHTHGATSCVIRGLPNGVALVFQVSARNALFSGAHQSAIAVPTTPPTATIDRFTFNGSSLTPAQVNMVKSWARFIKLEHFKKVTLSGYASREGTPAHQSQMGLMRARATLAQLRHELALLKVKSVTFRVRTYGGTVLVVPSYRATGGATSRRVVISYSN